MPGKIVKSVFFANYFIGILAIALSMEGVIQLQLPLNSYTYYLLLYCATVFYYTYAYILPAKGTVPDNPRTAWYREHHQFIMKSQLFLLFVCLTTASYIIARHFENTISLGWPYLAIVIIIPLSALLYYGLLPQSFIRLNLRNTGWIKPFVIGFVWACCVNLLPLVVLKIEQGSFTAEPMLIFWLFIKNWMFCTVNAIMFDMKDYADDANRQLKTFVVRMGLRKTIFYILIPLLLIGMLAMAAFFWAKQFGIPALLINLVPFICLLTVAYSLQRRKKILFYLIVIDGLLLVKAVCGIAGMHFILRH
jgi:4-hydroxybenzoate polyprenyltransferase